MALTNLHKATWLQIFVLTAFFSLRLLLDGNVGSPNEVDVLPLARQYAAPNWIPTDWYLNQPPGYRILFQSVFGRLAASIGFLATSIIGRLLCYTLISAGLVSIGQQIGLSFPWLLLATGLFLYISPERGVAASEWIAGGFESKSLAYGCLLLAIGLMLQRRYRGMALLLGLATSLHVLVGGWAFLAVGGWLCWRRRQDFINVRYLGIVISLYLLASAFAIAPVLQHLFAANPPAAIQPSYIYVFLRLPHHLNPLSWNSDWWLKPLIYLFVLGVSVWLLHRHRQEFNQHYRACVGLAEWTAIALIPFVVGLAIAPFDSQGTFLQYYPFRLGDVMLPLNAGLLFATALQTAFGKQRRWSILFCLILVSGVCSIQAVQFQQQLQALQQFPSQEQGVDPDWKDMCAWIRRNTAKNAVIVSPPADFDNFSWLTERATIAKFKLLPQTKAGIIAWYERLTDLSGSSNPWPNGDRTQDYRSEIRQQLNTGYERLTATQAEALMNKYQANYFVTRVTQQLNLPVAYRNSQYVLYLGL